MDIFLIHASTLGATIINHDEQSLTIIHKCNIRVKLVSNDHSYPFLRMFFILLAKNDFQESLTICMTDHF